MGSYTFSIALRDAATYGNDSSATGWRGGAYHGRDLTVQSRIGVLAHAARHEHYDVGIVGGRYRHTSMRIEDSTNTFGVVKVHLATKRLHDVGLAFKKVLVFHR
jgi:hypothetical protein